MCDCMNRVNEKLQPRNTKLSVAFCLSRDLGEMDTMIMIQTEKVDTKSRVKPTSVIPTFCPFCGVKYPRKDESEDQPAKEASES